MLYLKHFSINPTGYDRSSSHVPDHSGEAFRKSLLEPSMLKVIEGQYKDPLLGDRGLSVDLEGTLGMSYAWMKGAFGELEGFQYQDSEIIKREKLRVYLKHPSKPLFILDLYTPSNVDKLCIEDIFLNIP